MSGLDLKPERDRERRPRHGSSRVDRSPIDGLLDRNRDEQHHRETVLREALAELRTRDAADTAWLDRHGPAATRLLAIARELDERDAMDRRAERRLRALRHRDPLSRERSLPIHDRDLSR